MGLPQLIYFDGPGRGELTRSVRVGAHCRGTRPCACARGVIWHRAITGSDTEFEPSGVRAIIIL